MPFTTARRRIIPALWKSRRPIDVACGERFPAKVELQAAPKPHVLDDYTVARVFEVFGSQKDKLWPFEEQLARWKNGQDRLPGKRERRVSRPGPNGA